MSSATKGRACLLIPGLGECPIEPEGLRAQLQRADIEVGMVQPGATLDEAREAYWNLARVHAAVAVVGWGAGCTQALLLAEGFGVWALCVAFLDADARRAGRRARMLAMRNLFAVIDPTLVIDGEMSRAARRVVEGVMARDRRFYAARDPQGINSTILEHLCRNEATDSLANGHNLCII